MKRINGTAKKNASVIRTWTTIDGMRVLLPNIDTANDVLADGSQLTLFEMGEFREWATWELLRILAKKSTNASKEIKKVKLMLQCTQFIPDDVRFACENCKGCNGDVRDFDFPNAGSLVECAVSYYYNPRTQVVKTSKGLDVKIGGVWHEIKASLSCGSKSTPIANRQQPPTVLINTLGVWRINQNTVNDYINDYGRLPFVGACGTRQKNISETLGFERDSYTIKPNKNRKHQ